MKEPWMMFTNKQGQELIDNTTSTWTTINGVNGYKFISKIDTSKYIFLPAGGWWSGNSHPSDDSTTGYYWTNAISGGDASIGYYLHFINNYTYITYDAVRYRGTPIHPIAPPKPW